MNWIPKHDWSLQGEREHMKCSLFDRRQVEEEVIIKVNTNKTEILTNVEMLDVGWRES